MTSHPGFMAELAEARSRAYLMLVMFYLKRPTKQFIEAIRNGELQLGGIDAEIASALETIRQESLKADNLEEFTLKLGVEFTRLFRGVKKGYSPPPPYESIYKGERILYGPSTMKVIRIYEKTGYYPGPEHLTPPDYISVELEFMAYLAQKEAEAWRKGDRDEAKRLLKIQEEFLSKHLLTWVPKFCKTVEEWSKTPFYRAVARLTERYLKLDYQTLKELINKGKEG